MLKFRNFIPMNPHDTPDIMIAMLIAWLLGTIALFAVAIMLWY
jgi:hypothetical protein